MFTHVQEEKIVLTRNYLDALTGDASKIRTEIQVDACINLSICTCATSRTDDVSCCRPDLMDSRSTLLRVQKSQFHPNFKQGYKSEASSMVKKSPETDVEVLALKEKISQVFLMPHEYTHARLHARARHLSTHARIHAFKRACSCICKGHPAIQMFTCSCPGLCSQCI